MNTSLQPREVDKPFLRRWCLATLALLVRAPLTFGLVIAILGTLDTYAASLSHYSVMPRGYAQAVSVLISGLLPAVWVVVAALARAADLSLGVRASLAPIARSELWRGVLFAAIVQIVQDLISFVLSGRTTSMVMGQLGFVANVATFAFLLTAFLGSCYFPLLVRNPGAPVRELWKLSNSADELNGHKFVWRERRLVLSPVPLFVSCVMVLAVVLSSIVPAFGMTTAAFLVFLGVFNYVSYRDIFERRPQNAPVVSAPIAARPVTSSVQASG